MNEDIFKAYDIRGKYPSDIDEQIARKIGYAYAEMLNGDKLAVCMDIRESSPAISSALIDGITQTGCDVLFPGKTTTPMCYYTVGEHELDGGVMVTASHNPPEYTGFKLCRENAIPVSGETGIQELQERVQNIKLPESKASSGEVHKIDLIPSYREYLHEQLTTDGTSLSICLDGANGAVAEVFDRLFPEQQDSWTKLCMTPDGTFPNHPPNPLESENTEDLTEAMQESDYHFGVAFDGDGDRAIFFDSDGEPISSDLMTALLAEHCLNEATEETDGTLDQFAGDAPHIVYDLRSSKVVPETILKEGGTAVKERVGHSFIKKTMRDNHALFGGELSGHFYFQDHYYADSALVAFVRVLEIVASENKPIDSIIQPFKQYSQSGEINFEVDDKDGCIEYLSEQYSDHDQDRLDGLTVNAGTWWFNLRKSNTEPLLRLNLEADDRETMEKKVEDVKQQITDFRS